MASKDGVNADDIALAKALRELCEGVVTNSQIAAESGFTKSAIGYYMAGQRAIPASVLMAAARLLNSSIDAIAVHAGLREPQADVDLAIDADRRLKPKHRRAAKAVYKSFLELD